MGAGCDAPEQYHQRLLITRHYNTHNNSENVYYSENYEMWYRDTKWANTAGKMASIDLLDQVLPRTSVCKKK